MMKPCPFCGAKAVMRHEGNTVSIQCSNTLCGMSSIYGPDWDTDASREAWNTRPVEDELRAERDEMFKAYKELVNECLNDFVHLPEHRMTAEEYYWEELARIKRMEGKE